MRPISRVPELPALFSFIMICLLAWPAYAGVQLQETSGSIVQWVLYLGNHGPCSLMSWSHEPEEGIGFDFQTTGSAEEGCTESAWGLACQEDGLAYSGSHLRETTAMMDFMVSVESRIEAVLMVTSPTLLTAHRQVEGILGPQCHTVTVVAPDGSNHDLFGTEPSVVTGEMVLEPGTYSVILSVSACETVPAPFSYFGSVAVDWTGTVGMHHGAWDQIKAWYR